MTSCLVHPARAFESLTVLDETGYDIFPFDPGNAIIPTFQTGLLQLSQVSFPRSATIGMGAVGSEHDRLDGRGVGQAVDDAKGDVSKPSLSGSAHAQHILDGRADAA